MLKQRLLYWQRNRPLHCGSNKVLALTRVVDKEAEEDDVSDDDSADVHGR